MNKAMIFQFSICFCHLLMAALGQTEINHDASTLVNFNDYLSEETLENLTVIDVQNEMLNVNKTDEVLRDKRALGILLQGFMQALGYNVSPIQIATLPLDGEAAQNVVSAEAAPRAIQMSFNGATPTNSPSQRETLRFTGVLNFGNNLNASNLMNHLAEYERIFHGNQSTSSSESVNIADPRLRPPLPEPLFVRIPLPIVPNLPPPQPPSPMPIPIHNNYYDSEEHSEEFHQNKDDEGHKGNLEEEDDSSQHKEEYEHNHDEHYEYEPKDRNYPKNDEQKPQGPLQKHIVYKNNKNVVNYQVENKDINHPSEVAEEVTTVANEINLDAFNGKPDWEKQHEKHAQNIAAQEEARAEAIAEQNVEKEQDRNQEHEYDEEDAEINDNREKEIDEKNEQETQNYNNENSNEEPYYKEENGEEDPHHYNDDDKDDEDEDNEDVQNEDSQRNEARAPKSNAGHKSSHTVWPNSYEQPSQISDSFLKDSYGRSLVQPGGKVDERVASYFNMFKNPTSGIYEPNQVRDYENLRLPNFDYSDLLDGYNRIQKEYGIPENKYEEYEIKSYNDDKAEHRAREETPLQDESRKSAKKLNTKDVDCNCGDKKSFRQDEERSRESSEETVTKRVHRPRVTTPAATLKPRYSSGRKKIHDTVETTQKIISRLTSYEPPTTLRTDESKIRQQQSSDLVEPRILPLSFATQRLVHEAETKEIKAWPAPFDYVYDSSEHSGVTPTSREYFNGAFNTKPTLLIPTESTYHTSLAPQIVRDEIRILIKPRNNKTNQKRLKIPRENELLGKHSENLQSKTDYYSTIPVTQPTVHKYRKLTPYRNSAWKKLHSPNIDTEINASKSEKLPTVRSHRYKNSNPRNLQGIVSIEPPPTTRKAKTYDFYMAPKSIIPKIKSSNYYERDGILIIPEPTPYNYNEQIELTDEPQTNTERIKIKEYRNRIESVKVSELKQLHPEGTTQIFTYSRHL